MKDTSDVFDAKSTFDLDSLPVTFPETFNVNSIMVAINSLVKIIQENGGYRFHLRRTSGFSEQSSVVSFFYQCAQNESFAEPEIPLNEKKRDVRRMQRYDCNGTLRLDVVYAQKAIVMCISHHYHPPYVGTDITPEILDFININRHWTPGKLNLELRLSQLPGKDTTTRHQIYYRWKKANQALWRFDANQVTSARRILGNHQDICSQKTYEVHHLQGIAVFVRRGITALREANELSMDSTHGTNNVGAELFAVMGELDGTGVPLAYLFKLNTVPRNERRTERQEQGAMIELLRLFLQDIKSFGLNPKFFGTDKDFAEISAIKLVYPGAFHQLCLWHGKRALRQKLADTSKTKPQTSYRPAEAQELVPGVEICWASEPIRRPDGNHRYGICDCPSRELRNNEKGRLEPSIEERKAIETMFTHHYNAHPLIPNAHGQYFSSRQIHEHCSREAYEWCRSRDFPLLWAYLWVNWYQPNQWRLWARSVKAEQIPVLKTTMVVESHWRRFKHDFLHDYNRPRIDLVVWILVSRLLPSEIMNMNNILTKNHRMYVAHWRTAFKKEWQQLEQRPVQPEVLGDYRTDLGRGTCGCPRFRDSRFLICKHIIYLHNLQNQNNPRDQYGYFRNVRRIADPPFWILPQGEETEEAEGLPHEGEQDFHLSPTPQPLYENMLDEEEEVLELAKRREREEFVTFLDSAKQTFLEKEGDDRFAQAFMSKFTRAKAVQDEINEVKRKRHHPRTWGFKDSASQLYFD